jgi:hypothetical protein
LTPEIFIVTRKKAWGVFWEWSHSGVFVGGDLGTGGDEGILGIKLVFLL